MSISQRTLSQYILLGALICPNWLAAQDTPSPRTKPVPGSRDEWNKTIDAKSGPPAREHNKQQVAGPLGDQEIAAMKFADFQIEIELARLGERKAYNELVRQYAAKMVKDHRDACARLETLAVEPSGPAEVASNERVVRERPEIVDPKKAIVPQPTFSPRIGGGSQDPSTSPRSKPDAQDQYNRDTVNKGGESDRNPDRIGEITDREGGRGHADLVISRGALNWFMIQKQIGQQGLQRARRELAAKEEAEFDQAFMAMQIAAHQRMLDSDQVYKGHVSSDRRSMIEESTQMENDNLLEAMEITGRINTRPPTLQRSGF